jgi:hypothetical protein
MLPMQAAPHAGVVPPLPTSRPPLNGKLLDVWSEAAALAARFWARVSKDSRVTAPFRRAAALLARR